MTTIESFEQMEDLLLEDNGQTRTFAFLDRHDDPVLIFGDENGDIGFQMVPTDDGDDTGNGWANEDRIKWPLRLLEVAP